MVLKNPLNFIFILFKSISNQIKNIYLNSNHYDKKISKVNNNNLIYKPSPYLLSSLIQYQTKKMNINDIFTDNLWDNENINLKNFKKLNNFYWFFSLDLKSSKKNTQSIISSWIKKNFKYNSNSWEFDTTSKRIIAWLSNHNLTYDESNKEYQDLFNGMIQKQTNHLMEEIHKSELEDEKIIGCAAIILSGLCYNDEKNYLNFGLNFLKKISKNSFDNNGLPKSRDIRQLIFYLKYFILIREWFRESQIQVPELINETIYYLGQGYAFIWQNIKFDVLMNGNIKSNNSEFDHYLKRFDYKFKNENKEFGGYAVLYDKKTSLVMDMGSPPNSNYSKNYQSGTLSFEINSNGKKLISNCGYHNGKNLKLKKLSKSTATHSTLILDNHSSITYEKLDKENFIVNNGLKILNKNIVFEKDYWMLTASHNGYQKKYNSIHERKIEFFPQDYKFVGTDKILNKKKGTNIKFEIRFHLEPGVKLMKTQDNKTILIELEDEGWKFACDNFDINIDSGLYFGDKNQYTQNQNIFISGITNHQNESITWEIYRI